MTDPTTTTPRTLTAEGTHHCALAEDAARKLAAVEALCAEWEKPPQHWGVDNYPRKYVSLYAVQLRHALATAPATPYSEAHPDEPHLSLGNASTSHLPGANSQ